LNFFLLSFLLNRFGTVPGDQEFHTYVIFLLTLMFVATASVAAFGRDGVGHSGTSDTEAAPAVVSASLSEGTMQCTNQSPSVAETSLFAAHPLYQSNNTVAERSNTTGADEGASDKVDI
jgi:hypothetical protein